MSLTALHILFLVFVIAVGFWRGKLINFIEPANPENASGFLPFGASGVFNGAALVYVSYIGYDAVSTMAEEVENPEKNIPIGVTGSVIIVTVLYCLMAASMSALLPYDLVIETSIFLIKVHFATMGVDLDEFVWCRSTQMRRFLGRSRMGRRG